MEKLQNIIVVFSLGPELKLILYNFAQCRSVCYSMMKFLMLLMGEEMIPKSFLLRNTRGLFKKKKELKVSPPCSSIEDPTVRSSRKVKPKWEELISFSLIKYFFGLLTYMYYIYIHHLTNSWKEISVKDLNVH